ncbi:DUF3558 family protein [Nocardia abscessus]|uniref:DUF3558 family protein n=1 Tax=Nocardia abscessus TaxID=120957 RepID=UPI002457FFAE|nr:DUF3558 family protein [Nocardia abscessus]
MQKNVRSRVRRLCAVVLGSALVTAAGCEISGTATTAPRPTVLSTDTSPPTTPPWRLAELVNHPCTVLGPGDLTRFRLTGPGIPALDSTPSYCRWSTPAAEPEGVRMIFAPNPWHRYGTVEDTKNDKENFRTLHIAGRSAFLVDRRRQSGHRNCMIWVQVASGGLFQVEFVPAAPAIGQDVCGPAIEIAGVIAERIR